MTKKKKIIIGIIIGLGVIIVGIKIFSGGKESKEAAKEDNTEYYTIEDVDQVFINGIVTPVKSKEFVKDPTLGKLGDLNVKNGDNVKEGTVLYQYTDDSTSNQISDFKFQIEATQAEKEKSARQMQIELNELAKGNSEEGQPKNDANTQESIRLKYDINSFDMKMNQLQNQINELNEKQVNQVTAPFDGQVIIPQDQNRDSAIMTLTSNDFYVEGEVNERDLTKIKEKQAAEVKTISDNKIYKGEIIYISNTPTTANTPSGDGGAGASGGSSLSTYTVKLSLKDAKNVRKGFHVQSSIKLDDKKIQIPKEAVKTDDKDKKTYVFVDDFGTILRKDIAITEDKAEEGKVIVNSGLDALDKVIVKSDKPLKNGELLTDTPTDESATEELK